MLCLLTLSTLPQPARAHDANSEAEVVVGGYTYKASSQLAEPTHGGFYTTSRVVIMSSFSGHFVSVRGPVGTARVVDYLMRLFDSIARVAHLDADNQGVIIPASGEWVQPAQLGVDVAPSPGYNYAIADGSIGPDQAGPYETVISPHLHEFYAP